MYVTFTEGIYLWLLLIVPILIILHISMLRRSSVESIKFANFEALQRVSRGYMFSKTQQGFQINRNFIILFFRAIAYALLISSLSGATLHYMGEVSSFDYIVLFDASSSMLADDLPPNRFNVSKTVIKEFIDITPENTDIGLISFSGLTTIDNELTDDKELLKNKINQLTIKRAGGTAISDAIITSNNIIESEETMLVLLTDGQNNVGAELEDGLKYSRENKVIISVIGIGTLEGGNFLGINITSTIDKDQLQYIADEGNGDFFHIDSPEAVNEASDWMQENLIERDRKELSFELSWALLLLGLTLLIVEFILLNTRYKTIP